MGVEYIELNTNSLKITEETSVLSIQTNLSNGTYTVLLTDGFEMQLARIKIVILK